jgi:hypothetical protein
VRRGEHDYDFAVTFVFTQGDGEARNEAVWWLFYPSWDEPTKWGERLFHGSGGEQPHHDGYIVAINPNAIDLLRAAAAAPLDMDA